MVLHMILIWKFGMCRGETSSSRNYKSLFKNFIMAQRFSYILHCLAIYARNNFIYDTKNFY